MNKPNSVQWFLDKLIEHRIIIVDQTTYGDKVKPKHEILLKQAKAMHYKEIVTAYSTALPIEDGVFTAIDKGHKYYDKTFNNNEQQ